ncbi:hypothetical protein Pmar_PMAR011525 [Perkinsus marinus ATCC 50983]|uniref:Uncharacterized protein n=1 Tax=Perkinsus marinus (strain ATCC 50983 / TXsc) TaxID=423536 RepID=C5LC17_PERM5|nr:hypothetical protein Pmar_PMAR011525 [Perkinsus marinus ATCC 50983]EER05500.1 hypothetical protein Pmar_PMAR011525 [Perkinsus marinus ATCC 50983]|eukprot:XP_002773684.1 hypothetical protein Pmar_PMAR011525 [Perkinsus marinus ATCC 50983]
MSLVDTGGVQLEEISNEGVTEETDPMKNTPSIGEQPTDEPSVETVATNCAKALASLKGRREGQRLEKEARPTLIERESKLQDSGNEDNTKNVTDNTRTRSSSSSLDSAHGVWTPRHSPEEVRRMQSVLQQQWHLLWMVDSMNQHQVAAREVQSSATNVIKITRV